MVGLQGAYLGLQAALQAAAATGLSQLPQLARPAAPRAVNQRHLEKQISPSPVRRLQKQNHH